MKPTIEEVKVRAIPDDMPDTSWLGEYTDRDEDWAICRHCGEYVFNAERPERIAELVQDRIDELEEDAEEATESGNHERAKDLANLISIMESVLENQLDPHDCPKRTREYNYFKPYAAGEPEGTEDYQKYGLQDFERMEGLNAGDWEFIGIRAEALVKYEIDNMPGNYRLETFTSAGLWGIESDAGEYLEEVGRGELENLKHHLEHFNVDLSNWDELTESLEVEM